MVKRSVLKRVFCMLLACIIVGGACLIGVILTKHQQTDVYRVNNRAEFEILTEALVNRYDETTGKNRVVVEISDGYVIDENGNGFDCLGYYRAFDPEVYSKGDIVESRFVYMTNTNEVDAIESRTDKLIGNIYA